MRLFHPSVLPLLRFGMLVLVLVLEMEKAKKRRKMPPQEKGRGVKCSS